jgi:hypothetical protein
MGKGGRGARTVVLENKYNGKFAPASLHCKTSPIAPLQDLTQPMLILMTKIPASHGFLYSTLKYLFSR